MVSAASAPWVDLVFPDRRLTRDRALIMAVADQPATRNAISQAVEEGADLIDIGDPNDDELQVVSTVEWARQTHPGLAVSVRTERGEVAELACLAGADLLDDGWGTADPGVLDAALRHGSGYICAAEPGLANGMPRDRILVRVGADLTALGQLVDDGWQVLVDVADATPPSVDRLAEVLASTALAARAGAVIVRTRHVRATRHAVEMIASILGTRPPSRPQRWLG